MTAAAPGSAMALQYDPPQLRICATTEWRCEITHNRLTWRAVYNLRRHPTSSLPQVAFEG